MTPGRSEARVYAGVNEGFGRAWWDYDGLMVSWGLQDSYEVVRKGQSRLSLTPYTPAMPWLIFWGVSSGQGKVFRGIRRS